MAGQLVKHRFTVDDYHKMAEAGILTEDDRVELLDGEIVQMTPIGRRHAACVDRLTELLVSRVAGRAIVRVQNPVGLTEVSEPQPDLALLRRNPTFYEEAHPEPRDILMMIEVADASLETDREVKVRIYAEAGVEEVWLVDLPEQCVEVYRDHAPDGYRRVEKRGRGETLAPTLLPDVRIGVDELLG